MDCAKCAGQKGKYEVTTVQEKITSLLLDNEDETPWDLDTDEWEEPALKATIVSLLVGCKLIQHNEMEAFLHLLSHVAKPDDGQDDECLLRKEMNIRGSRGALRYILSQFDRESIASTFTTCYQAADILLKRGDDDNGE